MECAVEGCGKPARERGWCHTHYSRWHRNGDPTIVRPRRAPTHGMSGHPLYPTWRNMVARCTNPRNPAFLDYGGRGIGVHEPWLTDPGAFISWLETGLGERPDGHSLDRIDNDGNYEPGNLRWADQATQSANQRSRTTGAFLVGPGKWRARPQRGGVRVDLGYFATEAEAVAAITTYTMQATRPV